MQCLGPKPFPSANLPKCGFQATLNQAQSVRSFLLCAAVLTFVCGGAWAQVLKTRPPEPVAPPPAAVQPKAQEASIPLTVPAGTPIKVALDREVRIRRVGQQVHGKVVDPVYAFDRLVVPAGTGVMGEVTAIKDVSKKTRVMSALNANFSPVRQVQVNFSQLVLADGRRIPIHSSVSPASNVVLQFVPAQTARYGAVAGGKGRASREFSEVRQELKDKWNTARQELHAPGKMHKLRRYAVAQLPYHPQYLNPGTSFDADLQQPLTFGNEALRPEKLSAIGTPPPSGSTVHVWLLTPLSSADSKKGDPVEAVISQPLVVSHELFIPQGSVLKGSVLEAHPAHWFHRSGQLRIVFHELVPPRGIQQQVDASLEGVEVAQGEHLRLDSEGGAQVTAPRTRYLTTGLSLMLASSSALDQDRGKINNSNSSAGDIGSGAANGASGFRLVGSLAGMISHSRMLASGLGFYGAAMSVYSHFLSRGREVVYPKDMSMVVGFGPRDGAADPKAAGTN